MNGTSSWSGSAISLLLAGVFGACPPAAWSCREASNVALAGMTSFPAARELAEATGCANQTNYYHLERVDGRAWIVTPDGERRCALGVGHVPYSDTIAAQLKSWGFNNLGGGGDPQFCGKGFSHTVFLGFDQVCYRDDPDLSIRKATGGPMTAMPNMFHPDFPRTCDELASRRCASCRDDRDLLGYFLDNELAWWGQGPPDEGLFDFVASLPEAHSAEECKRITRPG